MFMVNTYRWDYPLVAALVAPIAILVLVAALFFVPGLSRWLWQTVFAACALIGLDARAAFTGLRLFQFWQ
jgi:hypothetical protein